MAISRNPDFYSVGIPKLFFYRVDNPDDHQAVDAIALLRAYNGIVNVNDGRVLNADNFSTCLTDTEILDAAYVGNITTCSMGGEISSVEHVVSNEGRKETDKVVLTRRSINYTMGFDEVDKRNMTRFLSGQEVAFPTSEVVKAKTTNRAPRAGASTFAEGAVEIISTGVTATGHNSRAFELLVTDSLKARGASFEPVVIGTPAPFGIYSDYEQIVDSGTATITLTAPANKAIIWSAVGDGTLSNEPTVVGPTGTATATLTAASVATGTVTVSAVVDGVTYNVTVLIDATAIPSPPPPTPTTEEYYLAGVYYFIVGNVQQYTDVDSALETYRNKLLCGYFEYDKTEGLMALKPWPANMDDANNTYKPTAFDSRIRVLYVKDAETSSGVTTNDRVLDIAPSVPVTQVHEWTVDSTDGSTQKLKITVPGNVARSSVRVTIRGNMFNAGTGNWTMTSESLYDATAAPTATDIDSPILAPSGIAYFADKDGTTVTYENGEIVITAGPELLVDAASQGMPKQTLSVTVSCSSAEKSNIIWTGLVWAKFNDALTTMRVNRGKPDATGCALVVFKNNVGVSFIQAIPKCTMRPDGTIEHAKDDWQAGSFIVTALKGDKAVLPNLPKRLAIPYGVTITFKHRTND